jgi:hypothetical protein
MLLSSLKKIGCKCLMRIVDLCRGGVSQLNGDDYSLHVVKNVTFIRLKVPPRSVKTVKEEAK